MPPLGRLVPRAELDHTILTIPQKEIVEDGPILIPASIPALEDKAISSPLIEDVEEEGEEVVIAVKKITSPLPSLWTIMTNRMALDGDQDDSIEAAIVEKLETDELDSIVEMPKSRYDLLRGRYKKIINNIFYKGNVNTRSWFALLRNLHGQKSIKQNGGSHAAIFDSRGKRIGGTHRLHNRPYYSTGELDLMKDLLIKIGVIPPYLPIQ